jgi:O-antigen biosynthesis protein
MPFNLADYPEAFEQPFRATGLSAWRSHIPVATILIRLLRPRTLVELGTHIGDSYVAFCQAVKRFGIGTRCTAIDTWQGDAHTGSYGPEILAELRAVHDPNFGAFSRLLPSTFDAAAPLFQDGSIDFLHIDGMHTYGAVRHDYENWRAKLSSRGVVLFHDTAERGGDFGVWKLWEEISPGRPHAHLPHGHGLGILAVGPEQPAGFLEFLQELNARPGLVKIMELLGTQVHMLVSYTHTLHQMFECQVYVNEWRQRTGQPIENPAPNPGAALSHPETFGEGTARDVKQLAIDALNLAAEATRLRAAKT